eukprot:g7714.t1
MPLPPRVRVLLFDLDETLWDCMKTIRRASKETQEKYPYLTNFETGIRPLMDEFPDRAHDYTFLRKLYLQRENERIHDELPGRGGEQRGLDEDQGAQTTAELVTEQFEFWYRLRNSPFFFDGVVAALSDLKRVSDAEDGPRGALIFGAVTDGNADVFRVEEVKSFFDFAVSAVEVGVCKPDEAVFAKAMEKARMVADDRLGSLGTGADHLKPENCIMIGDDFQKDIFGGARFGMKTCWINAKAQDIPGRFLRDGLRPDYEYDTLVEFLRKEILVDPESTATGMQNQSGRGEKLMTVCEDEPVVNVAN